MFMTWNPTLKSWAKMIDALQKGTAAEMIESLLGDGKADGQQQESET